MKLAWKILFAVAALAAVTLLFNGCSAQTTAPNPPPYLHFKTGQYSDRNGGVNIDLYCTDRNTAVFVSDGYNSGGVAAVPNSAECED